MHCLCPTHVTSSFHDSSDPTHTAQWGSSITLCVNHLTTHQKHNDTNHSKTAQNFHQPLTNKTLVLINFHLLINNTMTFINHLTTHQQTEWHSTTTHPPSNNTIILNTQSPIIQKHSSTTWLCTSNTITFINHSTAVQWQSPATHQEHNGNQ